MNKTKSAVLATAGLAVLALAGCAANAPAPMQAPGNVVALTGSNRIVTFDRENPAAIKTSVALSGLPAGQMLVGMDYRPADGKLYGLSNQGGLYVIDMKTGMATRKSQLMAAPDDKKPYSALDGSRFAVDFNPVADRLRVISDRGQNLRINVETGATINDGAINGAAGAQVVAAAYTDSYQGAKATALYVLDAGNRAVYLQNPPNDGTLVNRAALGPDVSAIDSFDIDAKTRLAYAVMTVGGRQGLYGIDVTGATPRVALGQWTGAESIKAIALSPAAM